MRNAITVLVASALMIGTGCKSSAGFVTSSLPGGAKFTGDGSGDEGTVTFSVAVPMRPGLREDLKMEVEKGDKPAVIAAKFADAWNKKKPDECEATPRGSEVYFEGKNCNFDDLRAGYLSEHGTSGPQNIGGIEMCCDRPPWTTTFRTIEICLFKPEA